MKWITRSHVHVDRIACPWLITRFIDSEVEFLFVPKSEIERVVKKTGAIPFDDSRMGRKTETYRAWGAVSRWLFIGDCEHDHRPCKYL